MRSAFPLYREHASESQAPDVGLSENLSRQFQLFLRGKAFVEFLDIGIVHIIALRRLIDARDVIQVPRNQLFAEEEGRIRVFRQIVIPDSKPAGIIEAAFAVKIDIPLKQSLGHRLPQ